MPQEETVIWQSGKPITGSTCGVCGRKKNVRGIVGEWALCDSCFAKEYTVRKTRQGYEYRGPSGTFSGRPRFNRPELDEPYEESSFPA